MKRCDICGSFLDPSERCDCTDATIHPNDVIKHIPTGREYIVAGVSYEGGRLIACGNPLSAAIKISDCALIHSRGLPQTREMKRTLKGFSQYIEKRR